MTSSSRSFLCPPISECSIFVAMLFLIAIAILLKHYGTHAVPLPVTTLTTSVFEAPILAHDNLSDICHSRTVLDIFWSCLATTFACTWVSVHPNVPSEGEGRWTLLRRRIFLMFFSILAPEFMIMWAFKQWRGALMIREAINGARPESHWTTTHGHFLQMGGFSYDEDVMKFDKFKSYLQNGKISFPDITEDEINDRSKGDALSKGIALLQLTWFILQIFTRAAQGLAVTELELTTAALAGLNSVMYVFWWSKPRDLRFPVVIRTKGMEKQPTERTKDTAWSFSYQEFDLRKYIWTSMSTSIKDVLCALRNFLVSSPETVKNVLSNLVSAIRVLPHRLHSSLTQFYRYFLRTIGDLKRGKSVEPKRTSEQESSNATLHPEPHSANMFRVHKIKIALFSGAKTVVHCFFVFLFSVPVYVIKVGLFEPIAQILNNDSLKSMVYHTDEQDRMFSMMFYSENAKFKPLFSTASIAGALFGGVHCLAWHFSFPSHAERIMWRTASLGVVGTCALSFLGTYTLDYLDKHKFPNCFSLLVLLLSPNIVVYPVSRLVLLVLALTSLRSLPSSAFDTVQWVEFVPHI